MSNKSSSFPLVGFFLACLCLLFISLKLTKYIDWSWWEVTSPLWIPVVIAVSAGVIYMIVAFSIIALRAKNKSDNDAASVYRENKSSKQESKFMRRLRENQESGKF